jgi:hypothetical protein
MRGKRIDESPPLKALKNENERNFLEQIRRRFALDHESPHRFFKKRALRSNSCLQPSICSRLSKPGINQ